ncbi:hypothetical protein UlMin_041085 [Ulmus minor]
MSLHPKAHVALFPSAGMGHLTPFLRLAASLLRHNCRVTLITTQPTVSLAESNLISQFLSSFPPSLLTQLPFPLLPLDPATVNSDDPFFLRFEAIRRSAHLLAPLLSSLSPPLSSLVHDVALISPVIPVTKTLRLPSYILFPASARMFSFFAYFPIAAASNSSDSFEIPGISPIPRSSIPPLLLNPASLFSNLFSQDAPKLTNLDGILINTFEELELESLEALNGGKVIKGLPPIFPVGPFMPCEFEKGEFSSASSSAEISKWLDLQPVSSVVFVSFGSRTALSTEQIREIAKGLVRSGFKFLWVVKQRIVDKEEKEEGLEEVLGHELMEKMKQNGLVVKHWVHQGEILGHKAVGGFVSHCGWNSLVEAAWFGVRVLAWPQHGDQKINAEVVVRSGLGMWVKSSGWKFGDTGHGMVKGEEIEVRVREMMESEALKVTASSVAEEARKAAEVGREKMFERLVNENLADTSCAQ